MLAVLAQYVPCSEGQAAMMLFLLMSLVGPVCFSGRPFDPHFLINNAVSNVICSLIYGERFDYDNKKFQRMLQMFEQALDEEAGFLPQVTQHV